MPHWNLQGSKPIHERSLGELIALFVVFPVLFGGAMAVMLVWHLIQEGNGLTWKEWLAVGWGCGLSAALIFGLPAAACQEWQRRKHFRQREPLKTKPDQP